MSMTTASIHNVFSFGETSDGKCTECGYRTVLVSFFGEASVDSEPFSNGESAEDSNESRSGVDVPESVTIDDELTGHFCLKCDELTSVAFNARRKSRAR